MLSDGRIDLQVSFTQKDQVKALGAKWDSVKKSWYIPPGLALENFRPWLPEQSQSSTSPEAISSLETTKGISLSVFLSQVTQVINKSFPKSEWIKCEISSIKRTGGHVYLDVVDYDHNRQLAGQARACIWQSEVNRLLEKFSIETGGVLESNMKVMLLCKVSFQPRFGLSLVVEDIDPTYTLGDMAAKLEKIRQALKEAGIFDNNKKLALPTDFFRIAVIAPNEAAGLGDFQEEANKLIAAHICDFQYFCATFQGSNACSSLREALKEVRNVNSIKPFDVLVIIRGGGAVTDLAWLNDEVLATELCLCPIPVLTGIGHEKDNTILDEVARLRLGTPSKVIEHIASTIYQAAQHAKSHISEIAQTVKNAVVQEKEKLNNLFAQTRQTLQNLLAATHNNLENDNQKTVLSAKAQVTLCQAATTHVYEAIISDCPKFLRLVQENCEKCYDTIFHMTKYSVKQYQSDLKNTWEKIYQENLSLLKSIDQQLKSDVDTIFNLSSNHINLLNHSISQLSFHIEEKSQNSLKLIQLSLESMIKEIMGFGPETILRRGYAITSSPAGKIITSTKEALAHTSLKLTFKDGSVHVHQPTHSEE